LRRGDVSIEGWGERGRRCHFMPGVMKFYG
jgi:hypothetical protein